MMVKRTWQRTPPACDPLQVARIRSAYNTGDISQADLAKQCDISVGTVYKVLHHKAPYDYEVNYGN